MGNSVPDCEGRERHEEAGYRGHDPPRSPQRKGGFRSRVVETLLIGDLRQHGREGFWRT
jgi:hypothetical protein